MRSIIILNEEQLEDIFSNELKRYDEREHHMNISLVNAHCGRITSDELYQLTFSGKFNFSVSN
ncbi:MAG: hypothetical protein HFJ58_01050 [Clostridia bacterium]|nr:hypothetical protein [Clostridia bacterium]